MAIDISSCAEQILEVGHCILPNHFPSTELEKFHSGFMPLLDEVALNIPDGNRGPKRWAIGLPFAPPYYRSAFFKDDTVNGIISCILGNNMYISYYGTDTPVNGSEYQDIHSDHALLFPEDENLVHPPFEISVRFVTVDMTPENGPFEAAERTQNLPRIETMKQIEAHRIPLKPIMLKVGDVLITDPRTLHRGTPNMTDTPRPFAVIGYHRDWYLNEHLEKLEANEETPMLMDSFYNTLSSREQHLLRRIPRTEA